MDTAKLFPWFILLNPLIAAVLILVATIGVIVISKRELK